MSINEVRSHSFAIIMQLCLSFIGVAAVAGWVYLAFWHGAFWRPLLPKPCRDPGHWPSVDVIVPARDEAETLPHTLAALLGQDYAGPWRVILVDDHSIDGTPDIARHLAAEAGGQDRLSVIPAPDLPPGWAGKVAAMQAGVNRSSGELILFTDADIRHDPTSLRRLVASLEAGAFDLVSRMVRLNCSSFAEKLLIPAFVFFFAMLYPFRRANDPDSPVAAAAGGTILMRRQSLDEIGGLKAIKGALIDDCSLARAVKEKGGKIELTLTRHIESLRPYPHIRTIWHMVARTAYTQLNYSRLLLIVAILGLEILYVAPPLLLLLEPSREALAAGLFGWVAMTTLYLPIVVFYGLPGAWALTLPLAALVYIGATIDSARLHQQGKGGQWKGRAQADSAASAQ